MMTGHTYFETEDREHYPPTQLVPLGGGRYVTVFHGPEGTEGVGDLHCELEPFEEGGMKGIKNHSGWKPDDIQAEMLKAGGHVRLTVYQNPIPPLAVSVEPPVCECHGEKMDFYFDGEEGSFTCRHVSGGDTHEPSSNGSSASALQQAKDDFSPAGGDAAGDEPAPDCD
jgi:hypothetical protein